MSIVKCPDCKSTNLYFYYHEYINCGADDNVIFNQNKKGEWVATFPKLKHEDLTRNELMGCNDCSSEFEINSCGYEDENGEYKNECIANLTEVEEDKDQVYWC